MLLKLFNTRVDTAFLTKSQLESTAMIISLFSSSIFRRNFSKYSRNTVFVGGWVDGWMGGRVDGWTGGRVDGWTGGRVDGWTDGRTDGRMENFIYLFIYLFI